MIIHDSKKTLSPSDQEKDPLLNRTRYFQGPTCGFTFGSGLAPFKQKQILGDHYLEEWLDFQFIGAALHKTDSLTVFITYLFAVCFTILLYFTIFTLLLLTDTPRPTRIN